MSKEEVNATEAVDWVGLSLAVMELGVAEGSLFGKVGLHKPIAHNGMYKELEISYHF